MSEEEKKAYDNLIMLKYFTMEKEDKQSIDIILNLVDKLQKENAELKEQRDNAIKLRNELIEEQKITCISKNEIRNKIKELEEEMKKASEVNWKEEQIDILEEILGE